MSKELKAEIDYKSFVPEFESSSIEAMDIAVRKSLAVMEGNIKRNTPVRTGMLRRSISHHSTGKGKGEVFTNKFVSQKGSHKDIDYAKYIEFGTMYIAPRAMFRKGVAQSEGNIKQFFLQELRKSLREKRV